MTDKRDPAVLEQVATDQSQHVNTLILSNSKLVRHVKPQGRVAVLSGIKGGKNRCTCNLQRLNLARNPKGYVLINLQVFACFILVISSVSVALIKVQEYDTIYNDT